MSQNPSAQTTNSETPEILSRPNEAQVAMPLTSVRRWKRMVSRFFTERQVIRVRRWFSCYMGSRHSHSCSANSFHSLLIITG